MTKGVSARASGAARISYPTRSCADALVGAKAAIVAIPMVAVIARKMLFAE